MWLQGVVFVVVLTLSCAVDHTIYRYCSEVDICSENRELVREDRWKVLLEGASFTQGVATFRVQAVEDSDKLLILSITAVKGGIFRVQIEELESTRYHIENVLDGEPEIVNFDDVSLALDAAILTVGNSTVIVYISLLTIEFYQDDVIQFVLDTDRLTLAINDLNTPFTFGVRYPQAAYVYGLHEHADHLALRTTAPNGEDPYRVKTMDLTNYELYSSMAMYGAVPVLYGHGIKSSAGLFLHNAAELWVEITNIGNETEAPEAYFMVDSGAFDLFILLGPSIVEVVQQYTSLTGVAHLPPLWTLGYHQCRWGYADEIDVTTVIATLDEYDFPVDVIWLDIQHTEDYKFFTWNPGNFSTPFDMLANLSSTHRYLVTLSDPHFKAEEGYFVYDAALENDYFIKNPNGSVFYDVCWPGNSSWMDYLNPAARDYYSGLFSYESWNGTTSTLGGIWNDMNEAAIFDEPNEKTFPLDLVHYGGVSNREIHNMYAFLQTMATHKGLIDRDDGALRPFILTRAHFAGSQRYAAFWTGDNTAEWGYIAIAYHMCLNSNLLGIVFCGCDVGGFFGEPSPELLERFYQAGAWLPFFREHANIGSERREPYLYDEDVQAVIRAAIKQRYAHLPVWYTLFFEHSQTGNPVIRPIFYHYPQEEESFTIDDQLLLGSDILVKVVAEEGAESVDVYFPGGEEQLWFAAELDGTYYPGIGSTKVPVVIDHIPVFYRQGSVILTKETPRPSTTDMWDDGYTLYVLLDAESKARGRLYVDDNLSFEYRESQRYIYKDFVASKSVVIITSIDESNEEGITWKLESIVWVKPEQLNNGRMTGRFTKTVHNHTAEGIPLKKIDFKGKDPVIINI